MNERLHILFSHEASGLTVHLDSDAKFSLETPDLHKQLHTPQAVPNPLKKSFPK